MSRYFLYYDDLRPSDSYLASHPDFVYNPDDWYSDDYDLDEDDEILHMSRTCKECGCSFTLEEAINDYCWRFESFRYENEFEGEYCGHCAADITEAKFEDEDE